MPFINRLMKTSYKLLAGLVLIVVVAVVGYFVWSYNSSRSDLANLPANAKLSDDQVSTLVAKVSQFLVVPSDEKPSVVVIHNAAELAAQQSFYKGAHDGDILIVYSSRAIIYDAKTNKLVNVGPIIRNDNPPASPSPTASGSLPAGQAGATLTPSPNASASPAMAPKPEGITVDVRNGSSTAGLAGATASTIKKNKLFTIGKVGDAKGTYKETVVVDMTKAGTGKAAAVQELAKLLKAKIVTKLPDGERASTADALVVVAK